MFYQEASSYNHLAKSLIGPREENFLSLLWAPPPPPTFPLSSSEVDGWENNHTTIIIEFALFLHILKLTALRTNVELTRINCSKLLEAAQF